MDKNYNENRDKNPDQIIKKFGKDVLLRLSSQTTSSSV